jgi:hypothetical protein
MEYRDVAQCGRRHPTLSARLFLFNPVKRRGARIVRTLIRSTSEPSVQGGSQVFSW